jgi:hypothetical protein
MFYAEFNDYDLTQIDDWLKEHIIANLLFEKPSYQLDRNLWQYIPIFDNNSSAYCMLGSKEKVKRMLTKWLGQFDSVQMWSDCLAYDWVLFNDIFGTAFDIPSNVNYIPQDICTMLQIANMDPDISRESLVYGENWDKPELKPIFEQTNFKHNAMYDAYIIQECYKRILFELNGDSAILGTVEENAKGLHDFYRFYEKIRTAGKAR